MNIVELEILFSKYNIIELDSINIVLEYVHNNNKDIIIDVLNKVKSTKEKACYEEFEVPVKPYNYSLLNILDKNSELSDKEIKFIHSLVDDASFFLTSIQNFAYAYEQEIEDFDICDYPIQEMHKLEYALYNEIENRNAKVYVK